MARSGGLRSAEGHEGKIRYVGLKGERITVVGFSPYVKDLLIVGTSADPAAKSPEMSLLDPRRFGRIYVADTGEMNLNKVLEKQGLGINNVAYESIAEGGNYLYFATTHGMYYCNNLEVFYQYRTIAADTPYLAVTSRPPAKDRSDVYAAPYSPTPAASLYAGKIDYFWSVYWNVRKSDAALQEITGLVADPTSMALWLCCRNGIFKSDDAGVSWQIVKKSLP